MNDLAFNCKDDLYFTDQGRRGYDDPTGRLFRWNADGTLDRGGIPSSSGLALNGDESILYLALTRANAVWRVPLDAKGHAHHVGTFLQLPGSVAGLDGSSRSKMMAAPSSIVGAASSGSSIASDSSWRAFNRTMASGQLMSPSAGRGRGTFILPKRRAAAS